MSASIYATLYDGKFDVYFECSDENQRKCKNCLTSISSNDTGESCAFRRDGSCVQLGAQIDAITKIVASLNRRRREIEDEAEKGE